MSRIIKSHILFVFLCFAVQTCVNAQTDQSELRIDDLHKLKAQKKYQQIINYEGQIWDMANKTNNLEEKEELLFFLCYAFNKEEANEKAINCYKKMDDVVDNVTVLFSLGHLYDRTNNPEEADKYYKKVLHEYPDSSAAKYLARYDNRYKSFRIKTIGLKPVKRVPFIVELMGNYVPENPDFAAMYTCSVIFVFVLMIVCLFTMIGFIGKFLKKDDIRNLANLILVFAIQYILSAMFSFNPWSAYIIPLWLIIGSFIGFSKQLFDALHLALKSNIFSTVMRFVGLVIFVVIVYIFTWKAMFLGGNYFNIPSNEMIYVNNAIRNTKSIGTFVLIVILTVFSEELFFRGVIFKVFSNRSVLYGAVVSSLLFSFLHFTFIFPSIILFLFGMLSCLLCYRTKTLYSSFLFHTCILMLSYISS